MRSLTFALAVAAVLLITTSASAQRRAPIVSPEVRPGGAVTLRLSAPSAEKVEVFGPVARFVTDTKKDESGLWTLTLTAVEPEVYEYGFTVDGAFMVDPTNRNLKQERTLRSLLVVPADPPGIHDTRDVPRGSLHAHSYLSKTLGGVERRFHVYTPPGYEKSADSYPVLYLLHGSGDNDSVWASTGRANIIADNLLAEGRMKPMLIVMPDGHAAYAADAAPGAAAPERGRANAAFAADLLGEIIPAVESTYRVKADANHRAVMGLSMGGGQTLQLGLASQSPFAWVGAFSSSVSQQDPIASYPALADPAALNARLKWFWIGCGDDDFLFERNNTFTALLKDKAVTHTYHVSDDAHNWACWRRYLAHTLPMLFTE